MNRFSVDYDKLAQSLDTSAQKVYRLEDVKDQIERVAFNVVRFRDNSDLDALWEVRETEQGPVIVALYDDNDKKTGTSDWATVTDTKTASLHVFYKGDPIVRLAADDLKVPVDELRLVAGWLPEKLDKDPQVLAYVLSFVGPAGIKSIKKEYPELRKAASASRNVSVLIKSNIAHVASVIKSAESQGLHS